MEAIIVFILISAVLLIMGMPLITYVLGIIGIMGILMALCDTMFIIGLIMYAFAKKKQVLFLGTDNIGKFKIKYAFYEIDGVKYKNFYPTDGFSEKYMYKDSTPTVRVMTTIFGKRYVYDKTCLLTMGLGAFFFTLILVGVATILVEFI